MAVKTFITGEKLTASDTNTYLNNGGLVYITGTTVGSAVSSVTLSNAFSSTFDCYRAVYSGGVGSVANGLALRVGGANANYAHVLIWASIGGAVISIDTLASAAQCNYLGGMTTNFAELSVDIQNPFIATSYTTFHNGAYMTTDIGFCSGVHQVKQSNTSVTLIPQAGTITGGQFIVYGYRKA